MTGEPQAPASKVRRGRGRPPGPPLDLTARRAALLDAAEVAIAQHGPDVGIADIAATAGLTRSAVYAAFADRDALLSALAQRHSRLIVEQMRQIAGDHTDPREQVRASVDILAQWFERQPLLARTLFGRLNSSFGGEPPYVITALTTILASGFAARGHDPRPASTWAHAVIGAVSATVMWWAQAPTAPRAEIVDNLTALIWGGFAGVADTPERP